MQQHLEHRQEPEIKEVKKLKDGSILLPYSKEISTGDIIDFDLRIKETKK